MDPRFIFLTRVWRLRRGVKVGTDQILPQVFKRLSILFQVILSQPQHNSTGYYLTVLSLLSHVFIWYRTHAQNYDIVNVNTELSLRFEMQWLKPTDL